MGSCGSSKKLTSVVDENLEEVDGARQNDREAVDPAGREGRRRTAPLETASETVPSINHPRYRPVFRASVMAN